MRLVVILAAATFVACGGGPVAPQTPNLTRSLSSTFFQITYTAAEEPSIQAIAAAADAAAPRVLDELGASGMPQVRVTYYPTHAALADAVRPLVGEIPAWASALVTSSRDIHLQSAAADGIARNATRLVHEYAHCATLHRNPQAANNPRWVWEMLAIYTARDRGDPSRLATQLAGTRPSLAQLNSFDSTMIYDVGFSIGEFVIDRGGLDALRGLLASQGNTQTVLGLTPEQFVDAWFDWARSR